MKARGGRKIISAKDERKGAQNRVRDRGKKRWHSKRKSRKMGLKRSLKNLLIFSRSPLEHNSGSRSY
jgi:hypothetical protein